MATTGRTSACGRGLLRVELDLPDAPGGGDGGSASGLGGAMRADSVESFESSSSVDDADEDKPAHPHHLKLLALSEVLMRSSGKGGSKSKDPAAIAGSGDGGGGGGNVGLLEEARNRWRGRKERCVHWDKVEINGREFPLQRADTSTADRRSSTPLGAGGGGLAGAGRGSNNDPGVSVADRSETSYLLVGHTTCDMCLMTYEASSVSGVITMKRILEARRDWGVVGSKSKKYAAASALYEPARLCTQCSQFFCSVDAGGRVGGEGGELVPCGIGRSDEHVSLSLESMASNKPLPDKVAKAAAIGGGKAGRLHRRRGSSDSTATAPSASTRSSRGGIRKHGRVGSVRSAAAGEAAAAAPNFRLDELIADNRFVVKETDLARQPGAVASQSSTADGMGADVCMGFPANRQTAARSSKAVHQRQGEAAMEEPMRDDSSALVVYSPDGGTCLESSAASSATVGGLASLDGRSCSSVSARSEQGAPPTDPASAAKRPATTASLVTHALATAPPAGAGAVSGPKRHTAAEAAAAPSSPPSVSLRADEIAAAAAAAARTCSRTRRENQPWWEVDLGGAFPVRCIRVHHPDRRTEATKAGASPFVDVAPFWIMTSAGAIGEAAPEEARELALSAKRVGSHGKVTVWNLGVNHFAGAVRVQAEGVKSLQLARWVGALFPPVRARLRPVRAS